MLFSFCSQASMNTFRLVCSKIDSPFGDSNSAAKYLFQYLKQRSSNDFSLETNEKRLSYSSFRSHNKVFVVSQKY